jgi:hypothetical protein
MKPATTSPKEAVAGTLALTPDEEPSQKKYKKDPSAQTGQKEWDLRS